jgi:uncharacterized protein YkwD
MKPITLLTATLVLAAMVVLPASRMGVPRALAQSADGTVSCDVNPAQLWPDAEEAALLSRVNALRASLGLAPYQLSYSLQRAALWKSQDMASRHYLDHNDGFRDWQQRFSDCGYPASGGVTGEDLAAGTLDAASTFADWSASPLHYANMTNPDFVAVGLKRATAGAGDPFGSYWTFTFASDMDWPLGGE